MSFCIRTQQTRYQNIRNRPVVAPESSLPFIANCRVKQPQTSFSTDNSSVYIHNSFNEILQRIIQLFFRIVYHNSPRHQYQPGPLVDICRLLPIIPAFCTQFVKKKKEEDSSPELLICQSELKNFFIIYRLCAAVYDYYMILYCPNIH